MSDRSAMVNRLVRLGEEEVEPDTRGRGGHVLLLAVVVVGVAAFGNRVAG